MFLFLDLSILYLADRVLLATRCFSVQSVESDSPQLAKGRTVDAGTVVVTGVSTRGQSSSELCFFHRRFGNKARRCTPPCTFAASGNTNAD